MIEFPQGLDRDTMNDLIRARRHEDYALADAMRQDTGLPLAACLRLVQRMREEGKL
jgi:hypothetical protein